MFWNLVPGRFGRFAREVRFMCACSDHEMVLCGLEPDRRHWTRALLTLMWLGARERIRRLVAGA